VNLVARTFESIPILRNIPLEINLIIKQEVNETAAEQERIKEFG
jgi:hypothetical protein